MKDSRLMFSASAPAGGASKHRQAVIGPLPGGGQSLPDAVAAFLEPAEEMAAALCHCADRDVSQEDIDRVADFVTATVLDTARETIKTPFAAAMVTFASERFKDELASRLAAKIGLRNMQTEGVA